VIDPLLNEEQDAVVCHHCESGQEAEPYLIHTRPKHCVAGIACASCIMAFEEGDAPEELAITLGNKDRGRACFNQTCPRYGVPTSWNFCQFCEHATVPI